MVTIDSEFCCNELFLYFQPIGQPIHCEDISLFVSISFVTESIIVLRQLINITIITTTYRSKGSISIQNNRTCNERKRYCRVKKRYATTYEASKKDTKSKSSLENAVNLLF